MPNLKTEYWKGHAIRFVEKDGEWWAVLKDVCDVLGLNAKHVGARLRGDGSNDKVVSNDLVPDSIGKPHKTLIVNEFGIYDTVFQSRKPAFLFFWGARYAQWVPGSSVRPTR